MIGTYFCALYSGSSGNCEWVRYGRDALLVDAGLSGKAIETAMESIHADIREVRGILITHEHSDHIKGAGILSRKYRIPIYANERTWEAMYKPLGDIDRGLRRVFESGEDFYIGGLGVRSFPIPHDAAEPVGYRIYGGGCSVSVATDMGCVRKEVLSAVSGSGLCLFESNHDPGMLMDNPHYSSALKQRILGRRGHLSNEESAAALPQLFSSGIRRVILGHLSGENNTPELALNTAVERLKCEGISPENDMQVSLAWRDRATPVYEIEQAQDG